ncbi:hypothetical protein PWT90_01132 [Aphanocladium album]|nr:hypothetical protein PWT90_01132 [Aphanocladium album]
MPSKSSGRIAKVRKNKYSTPHEKNHRWTSFSDKIAQFNSLQPLRRVRRHDLDTEDLSTATSYFTTGLKKWNELNISRCFVSFKQKVLPISESLPQILHFETRIWDLLEEHIAQQDKEGLEPLLDLLTAFAHDLGARFEKYYEKSLALIIAIASRPQPVEVIEWTFGTLAFLFKYLSKLLVPDVRPTYQVMSVLLGKARLPGHIARFAAEAMSFLVKKAAAPSHRETALVGLVEHIRADLVGMVDDKQFTLYNDGVMTMFAEAIKGTEGNIHSVGPAILTTLMEAIPDDEKTLATRQTWTDVVCGVLTSTIHHCRAEHFDDYAEAIYDAVESKAVAVPLPPPAWAVIPHIRILGILAGVRKGSRISNWNRLIRLLVALLAKMAPCPASADELSRDESNNLWSRVLVNVAIAWHHAPVDALVSQLSPLIQSLTREPLMRWFIPFCALFCEVDPRRFGSLLRGDFQKFLAAHWSHGAHGSNEEMLCALLPGMMENRAFPPPGDKDACKLPQSWQDQIVSKFENLEISPFPERGPYNKDPQVWRDRCLPKYAALLQILELTSVHPSTNARIAELLLKKLKLALRPSSTLDSDEVRFIVGPGFHAYLGMSKAAGGIDPTLSRLLRAALPRFARSVGFLRSYLSYVSSVAGTASPDEHTEDSSSETDPAISSLIENLGSPSHEIRLNSLQLLQYMNKSDIIEAMIQIEETPLQLQNSRSIGMLMRKLGQDYAQVDGASWVAEAVPSFLFGMLTVKLSPVWDDAIDTLKQVAQHKAGEEAVAKIAFRWIEVPSPRWKAPMGDGSATQKPILSDFDCTAYMALARSGKKVQEDAVGAATKMLEIFDQEQQLVEIIAEFARSRALKVFNALPAIAEKRSRLLVPHLLCWASESEDTAEDATGEDAGAEEDKNWSLADRKSIIGVFSQFVNPKVLYQHEKVYDALLRLLENGDVEVQKLALKGILAWKQEGVKRYQENLEFLLDEARFKNEIAVFLQDDELIKAAHKPQLMPVLLRLLYGRTISKKGAASGRHGLQATRLAVIRNLSLQDMGDFLDIAMGKLRGVQVLGQSAVQTKASFTSEPIITPRQQVGFLNMISSLITEMGSNVSEYMGKVLSPVLYCLIYACRNLRDVALEAEDSDKASSVSLLRVIRVTGIKCLISLFQNAQDFQWEPYHDLIIEDVVAPRIENLAAETTQGVSSLMHLFFTWSVLPKSALFLAPHGKSLPVGILPSVVDCITAEKTKDEVKIHSLEILRNLVKLAVAPSSESEFNELIKEELLDANVKQILASVTKVLEEQTVSHSLLEACVETILSFSVVVQDLENIQSVIRIASYLLNQPPRRVSPKTKGRILLIVESFVSMDHAGQDPKLLQQVYDTLSSLFSYFKDRENRQSLARALLALSKQDSEVAVVASLCNELNSYKEGRLDEPDYDRRLTSFTTIAAVREVAWTAKQWLPVLHNLIFFIRDDQEFGVLSTNSADGLRRFVQNVTDAQPAETKDVFEETLKSVLMPAIYACARDPSETVRRETLRVFGFMLTTMPDWAPIADLKGLLVEQQEDSTESAFFFNLLSPAVARQLEALKALEVANRYHEMGSQNLAQFFIPLLEHFIFGREDGADDHGLGAQATTTIGNLAMSLHWNHYRTTLQRYISYVGSKPELQKQTVRLAGRFADALNASVESKDEMEVDGEAAPAQKQRLATSVSKTQLPVDVSEYFLPPLTKYLHEKDESEVSYRVPVGVIIVKLLKLLPEQQMNQRLAAVLTDICHILRSQNLESRDLTRDTLVQIAVVLGPGYFGFILKQLRSALTRGYQLHVLSYTMHSILVASVPSFGPGDLNHCLPSIVTVIMDDIFGVVGQEKDAEGYTTQMKEIKGSKSQDSMELVAKTATITHLIHLVKPLQALLMEKVDLKLVRKIDALMSRITVGLLQNPAAESRDTLVFCYEVIQEVYNSQKPKVEQKMDPRVRKYLVQKGAKRSGDRGKAAKHTYKLMRFAFDILRAMLKKHDSLRTPENIAGFLPIMGDAIVDGEDEVKISAFRLLAVIVKVPMGDEGANLFKVAVREATKSISTSTSTTTDLAQAALKLLSVLLRDRRDVIVKDAAVDLLLGKLKDDFTEPLYRHVTFNFLRSVLERRIETAAVYDTLDHVGTIMITNDDKDTRDLARGAFFQFIREYPQKKARWAKQLDFIVANLKYDREGGRLSVMEMLHLLLMKASDEFVQQVASTCFLPLFFVLANDESEKCQLSAGELIKEIFRKADKERMQQFLTLLRSWLEKKDNLPVLRLGLMVFGYYFEANEDAVKNKKDYKLVLSSIGELLAQDVTELDADLVSTIISIVQLFTVQYPERILTPENEPLWINVALCLQHEDVNVRLVTIRLIAVYLGDFAKQSGSTPPGQALTGSHGLTLPVEKLQDYVRLGLNVLGGTQVDEALAKEVTQVIIFLGPRLADVPEKKTVEEDDEEDEEEAADQDVEEAAQRPRDIGYLFWRLSHILRKEIRPRAFAIVPKIHAMEALETVARRIPAERLRPSLRKVLEPLHHLTDPSIPVPFSADDEFRARLDGIKTRAQIMMDSLQKKFGTAEYTRLLLEIREAVRRRRQLRSSKRKIEAIAQPEKYSRDKRKKLDRNKERRKVRSKEQKTMRQTYKTW